MSELVSREGAFLSSSAILDEAAEARRNLIVEGSIEAAIPLHAHGVAVAATGRVRGDIRAAMIRVEGEVVGDLVGEVQVRVCRSASVRGDIMAPEVVMEPGAGFQGRIVMEAPPAAEAGPAHEVPILEAPLVEAPLLEAAPLEYRAPAVTLLEGAELERAELAIGFA